MNRELARDAHVELTDVYAQPERAKAVEVGHQILDAGREPLAAHAKVHACTRLQIRDLREAAQSTLAQFEPERSLESVAAWHAERLAGE